MKLHKQGVFFPQIIPVKIKFGPGQMIVGRVMLLELRKK